LNRFCASLTCFVRKTLLQVMHSDLKTKNVLLTKDGVTAKIGDVGLSQFLEQNENQPDIIAWTFAYASPEAIMNEKCAVSLRPAAMRHSLPSLPKQDCDALLPLASLPKRCYSARVANH